MTYEIYICQQFTRFLCLSILLLSGCTEPSDDMLMTSEETRSNAIVSSESIANLEERTFSRLQEEFPPPILDEDFKTFRVLAHSDTYLTFLFRVFKPGNPFENFGELLDTTPSKSTDHLHSILKQHLKHIVIDDTDIIALHKVIIFQQILDIRGKLSLFPVHIFARTPLLPSHIQEARDKTYGSETVQEWFRGLKGQKTHDFFDAYVAFAKTANDTVYEKTRELFNQHGPDDGLIWLSIQEPIIFWIILNTFMEPFGTADFLRWVDPEKQEN
ncbi:hypothetical protein F4X10_18655 [Candidatus Poribacteria bacterium]|nr:hypothetical protein [Candidatus Poribacteria bacterium]